MDTVYFYFDISTIAIGLSILGFFTGYIIDRQIYAPAGALGAVLALYAGRTIFGAPIDTTSTVAYFLAFPLIGIAIGNYFSTLQKTMARIETTLQLLKVSIDILREQVGEKDQR